MSEPFVGEIRAVGFNVVPKGWAPCNGQLLPIAQNQALFSILGTTYGGDGVRTFALPNLRGRVALGSGPSNALGQAAGATSVTLALTQIPTHAHALQGTSTGSNDQAPAGDVLGTGALAYTAPGAVAPLSPSLLGASGGNQPHDNMQPYQVVNYIIATSGVFPSRN